jgi:hypothetical protein
LASERNVVDLPVAFAVNNTNSSRSPCPSDGAHYTVRGHLTGPRSAILGPAPRAVTLYYQGMDSGEWNFRFRVVPGYDWAAELARLGHASVTIDQVGYGASGHPHGYDTCIGAQADIAHQIVGQLRAGTYSLDGARPVSFSKVVFAAHDVGGVAAEVEAYTYKDIDGLMLMTWQDQGYTPYILSTFAAASARCAAGGEPAYEGGPRGYIYFPPVEDYKLIMANSEPTVREGAVASRLRNPCGLLPSLPPAITLNSASGRAHVGGLSEVEVPVILSLGERDPVFTHEGFREQAGHFTGSRDVTSFLIDGSGHFTMLDRTAPRLRALTAEWLTSRRFLGAGVCPSPSTELHPGDAKELARVGPSAVKPSLPERLRVGARGIGPARLGGSHSALAGHYRAVPGTPRAGSFCVHGGGRLVAGSRRDTIDFLATTAPGHRTRASLGPGRRVRRGRLAGARRIGRGLFVDRQARGRLVYGVRGGRTRFVAVMSGRLGANRHSIVRVLRAAGLIARS